MSTITGRRRDLEAIEVNAPESYIGGKVLPTLNVAEKSGTFLYKTITADAAAQVGRVAGVAPTRTLLTDSSASYTVAEAIQRYGVVKSEEKQMGGIAIVDRLGAVASKRSVLRAMEDSIAGTVIDGDGTDVSTAIIDGILDAGKQVKRYAGKLTLVMSYSAFRWTIQQTEITSKMAFNGWKLENASDVLSMQPVVLKSMLSGMFGVDELLIGDDDHWAVTGHADTIALVKVPEATEFSHKLDPVLGRTMVYLPDGEQPFEIESFYSDIDKTNNYDCTAWYQPKILNSGAKVLLDGFSTP